MAGLFDDPFGGTDPFRIDFGLPRGRRPAPEAAFPPPDPEEIPGLTDNFLHRVVSGLSYVGSVADKFGGRAIRGALAGRPRELLSVVPFSDSLGLTDYERDRTSGEDLLKHFGWDTSRGNWATRNLAPIAAEVATDPLSYLSFGTKALTPLGKVAEGLGATKGLGHRALIEGFEHAAPAVEAAARAAGASPEAAAGAVGHLIDRGRRVASADLVNAAAAKGITDVARKPLAGLVGVGLPFGDPRFTLGHGGISKGVAGAFDVAKDAIKFAPGIRNLRDILDTKAGRATHPEVQRAFEAAGKPTTEAFQSQTWAREFDLRHRLEQVLRAGKDLPGSELEALKVMRGAAEDAPQFADPNRWAAEFHRRHALGLAPGVADPHAVEAHVRAHWNDLAGIGREVRAFGAELRPSARHYGVPDAALDDPTIEYAARRYIAANPAFQGSDQYKLLPTHHGSNLRRQEVLREIEGGTEAINDWAMDPRLSGPLGGPGRLPVDRAAREILQDMVRNRTWRTGTAPADLEDLAAQADAMARWLTTVPAAHAERGIPYFNPDLIGDLVARGRRHAQVLGPAQTYYRALAGMAKPIAELDAAGVKRRTIPEVLEAAGLESTPIAAPLEAGELAHLQSLGFADADEARSALMRSSTPHPKAHLIPQIPAATRRALQATAYEGATQRAYEAMARRGFGPGYEATRGGVNPVDALNQWGLADEDAGALTRFMKGWIAPSEVKPFLGKLEGLQTLFKNAVYPMWPASHVRNAISALYNNWIHGTPLTAYRDALDILGGRGIHHLEYPGLTAVMSPEARAQALARGAYADAGVHHGLNAYTDRVGVKGLDRVDTGGLDRIIPRAPGPVPWDLKTALTRPGAWDPRNQAGVFGRLDDTFAPLVLGRTAGTKIEDAVRLANYLGNLRRGMASDAAGRLTKAIHFDYGDLTPFERNVMKSLIPFYTFTRKNLPEQLRLLTQQPGKIVPSLRAVGNASGRGWVPEYLASGAAIPVGEEQGGTQRYLAKLGLPFEEALERLQFRGYELPNGRVVTAPSFGQTTQRLLGQAGPLVKLPLEMAFDTQLHTGRRLSDLYTKGLAGGYGLIPEEYAQPLSELVAGSPLSRFVSTADRLQDPRKGVGAKALNFLTGFKLTDVDQEKQRDIEARRVLERLLRSDPRVAEFTNYYLRPDQKGHVTPELAERLGLFNWYKQAAKRAAEEKRRAAGL
jgi:hypothetical protein